jgi:hypothetical protein
MPRTRPTRVRRPVALGAGAALAVLLVTELAARSLALHLPAPDPWGDAARTVKIAQMDHLRAVDGCVDVVMAGDSMARDGFDPAAFNAHGTPHRDAYNASLDAAGPDLLEPWLVDQVIPRLRPSTVLIAISSIDLNRHGAANGAAVEAYATSPGGRRDLLGRLDRLVSDHVALVGHRRELRDADLLLDALRRENPAEPFERDDLGTPVLEGVLGPGGEGRSRAPLVVDLSAATDGPAAVFTREQLLGGFALVDDPVGRLARLVDAVRDEGAARGQVTTVVLVVLPTTDAFASLHPNGADDVAAARQAVLDAATTAGVPVVDFSEDRWPADHFADTHHLNGRGARRLSAELATRLDDVGAEAGACPGRDR